jgi:Rhodopirellula transposase DDE domain
MAVALETVRVLAAVSEMVGPHLDERQRRLLLGAQAAALGEGGIAAVAGFSGAARQTVARGAAEVRGGEEPLGRVRRAGGGRKRLEETDPGVVAALLALVADGTRGDPASRLVWTTRSLRNLAGALAAQGYVCGPDVVARLLRGQGFSLQGNARTIEGARHPDRDAQFGYIAARAQEHIAAGDPVISVDAKKKEQVGQFANAGREWRPAGDPVRVRDHDFPDKELGKVTPYGIYDVAANTGWVNVGTDHDTAAFAVESIRRWWDGEGRAAYPAARRLLITADAGGSNGYQSRAWKAGLAGLAEQAGLEITVCHFPPGTYKWNKIEHRLFAHITMNWRSRPLTSHEVIVNTIEATTTAAGLTVTAALDDGSYPTGITISDEQMNDIKARALTPHDFHGDWNYTIVPPAGEPASPPAPPAAARPGLAALAHPALTGMTAADFAYLATSLELPAAAAREQRLHLARGGPRRQASGPAGPLKLGLDAQLLAAIYRYRLGMTCGHIAVLLAIDPSVISIATRRTARLLSQRGTVITPAPARLRTLDDLRRYATETGITIPAPAPLTDPGHPTRRE